MGELPRGTVTLLFTYIEETAHLPQQVGEDSADMLQACRLLLHSSFQQFHGREIASQDNAFFVAFGNVNDALSAAVEAQRALAILKWPDANTAQVRMGLSTGVS